MKRRRRDLGLHRAADRGPVLVNFDNRGDEPVAAFRYCFDESWIGGLVIKCFADQADMEGEVRFFDETVRPKPSDQNVLFNQCPRAFDKSLEKFEGLWCEMYVRTIEGKRLFASIKAEIAELINRYRIPCFHVSNKNLSEF